MPGHVAEYARIGTWCWRVLSRAQKGVSACPFPSTEKTTLRHRHLAAFSEIEITEPSRRCLQGLLRSKALCLDSQTPSLGYPLGFMESPSHEHVTKTETPQSGERPIGDAKICPLLGRAVTWSGLPGILSHPNQQCRRSRKGMDKMPEAYHLTLESDLSRAYAGGVLGLARDCPLHLELHDWML